MRAHPFRLLLPLIILTAATATAGCAGPSPIVRLTPIAPNVLWVSGRASVQKEETGVRVAVAFEHQDGPTLGVRVEVQNLTPAPLDLKPQDFSYVTCSDEGVQSCGGAKPLVDPERVLEALDVNESRERAAATNDANAMAPLLLLSVVSDVAAVSSGHASRTTGLQSAAISNQMDNDAARHDSSAATISAQRQMWSNAALRHNTLMPGDGVGGYVYIPIESNVRYLWLTVRTADRRFPFCFRQVVTEVDPPGAARPQAQWRH